MKLNVINLVNFLSLFIFFRFILAVEAGDGFFPDWDHTVYHLIYATLEDGLILSSESYRILGVVGILKVYWRD